MEERELPPPPPVRRPTDFAFLISAGIAVVAALVLARNLLPAKQDLADTLRREENLRKEIDSLRKERELLDLREKALQKDPLYMERELRGQTGMSRPDEFLVK